MGMILFTFWAARSQRRCVEYWPYSDDHPSKARTAASNVSGGNAKNDLSPSEHAQHIPAFR
jgi:hypothetical protein